MKNKGISLFLATVFMCSVGAARGEDAQAVLTDLHQSNLMEIHMGRMATEKGQSDGVRAYGKRLMKDHTDADKKVEALAQKQGIVLEAPGVIEKKWDQHTMHELGEKSGADFDKAFAKEMIDDHQKDVSKLEKAQQSLGATPTGQLIAELLPTLRDHLAIAQKLAGEAP